MWLAWKSCHKRWFGGFCLVLSCQVSADTGSVRLRLELNLAELMTEIRYQDRDEPDQPPYTSRILVLGERMRMDYGRDDEGFILFDRHARTIWHVAPGERRMTGIASGTVKNIWPKGWRLSQENTPSGKDVLSQIRLNGALCVEFKTAPLLQFEARLLGDFRRLLTANHANTWLATPEDMRQPCQLALDVHQAGVEYDQGLPLAVRYWDGRSRVYQGHDKRAARPELFELPEGYLRFVIGGADQETATSRQSRPSQAK